MVVSSRHVILDQSDSFVNTEAVINNFLKGTPEATYANVARGGQY